jgi:hypothetical protein
MPSKDKLPSALAIWGTEPKPTNALLAPIAYEAREVAATPKKPASKPRKPNKRPSKKEIG